MTAADEWELSEASKDALILPHGLGIGKDGTYCGDYSGPPTESRA